MADHEQPEAASRTIQTENGEVTITPGKVSNVESQPAMMQLMQMLSSTMADSMKGLTQSIATGQQEMLKVLLHGPGGPSSDSDDDESGHDSGEPQKSDLEDGELGTVVTAQPKSVNKFLERSKAYITVDTKDVMSGGVLSEDWAEKVTELMRQGPSKQEFDDDHDNDIPSNCEGLRPVKCNKEVWNVLPQEARKTDIIFQKAHKQVLRGAAALSKVGDILNTHFPADPKDPMVIAPTQTENLLIGIYAGLQTLGHANAELVSIRRQFLRPSMAPEMRKLCNTSQAFTDQLFGDEVAKDVETVEVSQKLEKKLVKETKKTYTQYKGTSYKGGKAGQSQAYVPWWKNRQQTAGSRYNPYQNKQQGSRFGNGGRSNNNSYSKQSSYGTDNKSSQPFLGGRKAPWKARR